MDHIKCRAEAKDWAEYINKDNKVLACYRCNQERNNAFLAQNPNAKTAWDIPPLTDRERFGIERSRLARKLRKAAKRFDSHTIYAPATGLTHY